MHTSLKFCLATMALGTAASAQDFIGFSYNVAVGATSRGALVGAAGEVMVRIDGSDYAGWGTDTVGFRTISSIFTICQDQDAVATSETFDITLYPEGTPGFPDLTQPVPFATGVLGPAAPATGVVAAAARIVTPLLPVAVPIQGGGDIFVAFSLPAAATWPADGMSINIALGYAPNATFTIFDVPGQAQQPLTPSTAANSHGLSRPTAGAATYNARRMLMVDIAHSTAGGVVMGITNQTSYVASNNPPPTGWGPAPGTASFMSGVSPDVSVFTPGRADDVTMDYFRTAGSGAPLTVFLINFGGFFTPELPITSYGAPAGSTGVACLNPTTSLNAGIVIGAFASDEAFKTLTFAPAVRPLLVGFRLVQQAIEFDTTTNLLHSSPCGRQVF